MQPQSPVANLFDQLADVYDAVDVDFFKPIAQGLVEQLLAQPGDRALDIGCGKGAATVPLADAVAPGGSVVGIDVSPRMVELARAAIALADVEAEVRVGDAMAPNLPDESFDLVASSLVLFFLPDPLAALKSWRALLVDGGRVGVATFGQYDERWRVEVDDVLRNFATPNAADARTTGQRGPFVSDAAMETLVRDAGFREVRTATATVSPRFDEPEHWYRWSMSVGQRQFWEAIPAGDRDEIRSTVLAAVDQCRDATGRIGFDQEVRYTLGIR